MFGASGVAKSIGLSTAIAPICDVDPTAIQINGMSPHRLAEFANWRAVATALADRALLVRIVALYGCDPDDAFGLILARESGHPHLMRMAAAQILDDADLGDADACAFMASAPITSPR